MKAKDYIKQINDLPESEWDRMKEHMDKKFGKYTKRGWKGVTIILEEDEDDDE